MGSIPLLGRSPGEGKGNHSSILAWKIPWTKEPGRVQWGSKELDMTESLSSMVPFTLIVFQISSSLSFFFLADLNHFEEQQSGILLNGP